MKYDIDEIYNIISNFLFDNRNKININDIRIKFSIESIKAYLKLLDENESDEYNKYIIDELLKDEINEFNHLTKLNLEI